MNLWSHRFSQNTNKKLSRFLLSLHRAEILTIFHSYFERNNDVIINLFWNLLTTHESICVFSFFLPEKVHFRKSVCFTVSIMFVVHKFPLFLINKKKNCNGSLAPEMRAASFEKLSETCFILTNQVLAEVMLFLSIKTKWMIFSL